MDIVKSYGSTSRKKKTVRKRLTRLEQEARIGLFFLSPWLIGFVFLKLLPILAALVLSFTDFRMLTPEATKFVRFDNYIRFFGDAGAISSLLGSLGYFLTTIPLEMFVALALAAIFTNARLKNKRLGRTLIFMTSIIPATSIFFIFQGSLEYV